MKNLISALALLLFFSSCSKSSDPVPSAPLPVVNTTTASSITQTTAVSGGAVITAGTGNSPVTERGVCWSAINTSPTVGIAGSYSIDGSGLGSFTSSLTGLTANTTYYYRAYATNISGTNYGGTASFTTLP